MNLSTAITEINKYFVYLNDSVFFIDKWKILSKNSQGELRGDCEDYSLTIFWYLSDMNIKRFLWNLLITHKYELHLVKTTLDGNHMVGCYNGMWFDNWTKRPLSKEDFFFVTGHKRKFKVISPFMILPLLKGYLFK